MNEVLRQEKKFLISLEQYYRYSHHLAAALHMDAHSRGEGYLIRSLYFDTLDDKDFEDKEDAWNCAAKSACAITAWTTISPC